VRWPASLKQLAFGVKFGQGSNRPIEMVKWPGSLEKVTLGETFDQAIRTRGMAGIFAGAQPWEQLQPTHTGGQVVGVASETHLRGALQLVHSTSGLADVSAETRLH
ncbi:unnamed protein product, partial [Scytosiphon promiscuus]